MEPAVGEVWSSGQDSSNLLGLPGPCAWDDEDEPLGLGGIKPKSSPIPRRRSSASSCSDDDFQPPPSSSRRVSFADAFGLSLVSVKQFDSWATCGPPDSLEGDVIEAKECFLSLLFTVPPTLEELIQKVQEHKLELESLELLPGTTTLKGIIRVLNLCFDKLVYIRTSLDCWTTHFDLLAEYVPGTSDGDMDCFSFRLTLVPPFGEQGARVDFCLRYETPFGTFWANNGGQNYVLFCHERTKEEGENGRKRRRKSCLKSTSCDQSSETSSKSSTEEIPEIILNCGMAAVAEPVAVKEEKMQKECIKLEEENIRNRSRRSRRKAARLAKVRQYFAEREEKDLQQTDKDTKEASAKKDVEKPVSDQEEAPSNLSPLCPSPADPEKNNCTQHSVDTDSQRVTATHIQTEVEENISAMHSELQASISQATASPVDSVNCHKSAVSSVSQALNNSQNKETLTGQTASVSQQALECQSSEPSFNKSVEKAWECFEKGAREKLGSAMDRRTGEDTTGSGGEENHRDEVVLENNPGVQPFKFEMIVAPLYHQVFERMETERRDTGRSVGKLDHVCLRTVTSRSYPKTQSVETRPNACTSEKHVVNDVYHGACKEPFPPDLSSTRNSTEKTSAGSNVNTELEEMGATLRNISVTDMEDTVDMNIAESEMAQMVTPTPRQYSANSLPFQLECLNKTHSSEECTLDQDKPHDGIVSQSEHLLDRKLPSTHLQSECSPESSLYEPITTDNMLLTTMSELDKTNSETLTSIVFENPSSKDSSAAHASWETGPSTETLITQAKEAQSLQHETLGRPQFAVESTFTDTWPSHRCQEESPVPDSSFFNPGISSNVTSNFSQSEAPASSQHRTPLSPEQILTSVKDIQTAADTTHQQFQTTDSTKLMQGSDNMHPYTDTDSYHVSSETESRSERNTEADGLEKMYINREQRMLNETLQDHPHVNEINKDDCNEGFLDEDKETSILRSNNNSFSLKKEAGICEDDKCSEDLEQDSTDKRDHQSVQDSEKTKEIKELKVKKEDGQELEEVEEKQQKQEKEEQEDEKEHQEQDKLEEGKEELEQQEEEGQQRQLVEELDKEEPEDENEELEEEDEEDEVEQLQELEEEKEELESQTEEQEPNEEKGDLEEKNEKLDEEKEEQELERNKGVFEEENKVLEKEIEEQRLEEAEKEQKEEEAQPKELGEELDEEEELEEEEEEENDEEVEEEEEKLQELDEEKDKSEVEEDHSTEELGNGNILEEELLYIDDDEEDEEGKVKETELYVDKWQDLEDRLSLEVEIEQERVSNETSVTTAGSITNVDSFKSQVHLYVEQEQLSTGRTSEKGRPISGEGEISSDMDSLQKPLTENSDLTMSDRVEFMDREEEVSCHGKKQQAADDTAAEVNTLLENPEDTRVQREKYMDDSASTESLTDDEMELYLHRLRSTQQPGFRDAAFNGNYSKKSSSVSRTRTMPSPMPSISESVDEDQPSALLEDLTKGEMMELEKATFPPVDGEEEAIRRNALWWREFFSSDNTSKMMWCTLLLVVFLVTAYYYDFIACFGLYLLALYWLYFRGESEPSKVTQSNT